MTSDSPKENLVSNHHTVAVTTRLDDEGTEKEQRVVESVKFTCTAPDTADCHTYPKCDCEQWRWDEGKTHDDNGHERVSGQKCWLIDWFDNDDMAVYSGSDADYGRNDYVPAVDRSGAISTQFMEVEYVEWSWVTPTAKEDQP